MNYFELYDMPVQMKVDGAELRKKFYSLSRLHHPDYHSQETNSDQGLILEKSAEINRAYKTFQNPDDTIRYVLFLKGLLTENEKYELGTDFLAEVMEINELLMDLEFDPNPEMLQKAEHQTKKLLNDIYTDIAPIVENYEDDASSEKELLQVKDYYYRKKYLQRILDRIHQMRNIAPL